MSLLQEIPFNHVGFVVKDREAACRALEKTYGLDEWTMVEYRPGKASCWGKPAEDYYVKAAVHPSVGGCGIEIIQPVSEGMHMDFFRRDPNGINHVCHTVKDYEAYRDRFLEKFGDTCQMIATFPGTVEAMEKGYGKEDFSASIKVVRQGDK